MTWISISPFYNSKVSARPNPIYDKNKWDFLTFKINEDQYIVTFQSRFGKQVWLQPYTDEVLENLASDGINNVDVFCPGFLCDF